MSSVFKILIVDDDHGICESLKELLSCQEYELKTSNSAKEAIEHLKKDTFDLMLLDIFMPDENGYKVMDYITSQSLDTLVVVMTGQTSTESAIKALRRGAYDYLKKPFEPEKLLARVENALDHKKLKDKSKQVEKALRESESKFRNLFDLAPQAIALTDLETGKLFDVNNAFCRLTKYSKEEVIGKTTVQAGFYADLEMSRFVKELYTSGEVNGLEMDFKAKDGSILTALTFAKIIQITGESFILTIFLNVTEQKQLQSQLQQAQKMKAIGTLAGGVAHDFNNLLMGIEGRSALLLLDMDSLHPHYEHLKAIEHYVKSAADLTNQLLAFARGGKYEVRPTDLNKLIKDQNCMFGRTKKEITIHGKYEESLWSVEVDGGQIEQVLLNLYVNASQSMPGGGDLYIQTENAAIDEEYVKPFKVKSGKYVKISVTDTGVGMDKATQKRIFDPFFTTKEMGRGAGLGLSSVYGIIKNHGGIINVYSEKGKGTTFNIYLPASEKVSVKKEKSSLKILKGVETILFVDDEEMIVDLGKELLKRLGYKVLVAKSGEVAIELYETYKDEIDIVILDMIMPNMGGSDTYERMKKMNPDIKVLLSSGYSVDGQATEILDRGCNGFIQKPFNIKDLSQKIREILDKN